MSPLLFLAIPVLVFTLGSSMLVAASRWRLGRDLLSARHVPANLRVVAPMVRDQRQAGWQSGVGDRRIRS